MPIANQGTVLKAPLFRLSLAGIFIAGVLVSFLGAILPAWQNQSPYAYSVVGVYFLCLTLGLLGGSLGGHAMVRRTGISKVLAGACLITCLGFVVLAFASPPTPAYVRGIGVSLIGLGGGGLVQGIFYTIVPVYDHDPAGTVNLSGIFFGSGCLLTSLLVAGTFYVYSIPVIILLIALLPAVFVYVYFRSSFPPEDVPPPVSWREMWQDVHNPAAILFSLLLFFQFGNEWALAGWLPIFLVQRLGASPDNSLLVLALYFLSLLTGRVFAQWLLSRVSHTRLLLSGVLLPMFGCFILWSTNNLFGASTGILFAGFGFSVIYPLVVEKVGRRFPSFRLGLFSGIFSLAITGGTLAPATLGFFAEAYDIQVVALLPLIGSIMVFLLLLLVLLEARLSGGPDAAVAKTP